MPKSRSKPLTWFVGWAIVWSLFFVLPAILFVLPRSEQGTYLLVMLSLVTTYTLFLVISALVRPSEQPKGR